MANALEQPLFLPQDVADLRTLKTHDVFLTLKRDLAMVSLWTPYLYWIYIFLFHLKDSSWCFLFRQSRQKNIVEEWVDDAHKQWKDDEAQRIAAIQTLAMAEKRIQDLNTKLAEVDRERKSGKATLVGVKKQAEDQR